MANSIAQLRHRELTQEIYNIGDEVAEYIEHLMEAIADWDVELVEDCLAEFREIATEAVADSRMVVAELAGLRQALTSGIRRGTVSARASVGHGAPRPESITAADLERCFPIDEGLVVVRDLADALNARSEAVRSRLGDFVEWILAQTEVAAGDLDALSLPRTHALLAEEVETTVGAWTESVAVSNPAYVRTRRGDNPPAFLAERARVDAVVARVASTLQGKRDAVS
ncbi:hypothetical protein [Corynebacterium pacaense]|uniref:hypothetical protein n=1 Tax=Corynebacterium pacaense TaxID=1816684 RepID=UPI0009B9DC89|nr:hypothetical protein [Corynebacterium pacaense]